MARYASFLVLSLALASPTGAEAGFGGVTRPSAPSNIAKTQFVYGGDPYCWFDDGWQGPGWYRCDYGPWVRGYWWGGGYGWNGWRGGRPGPRFEGGGPRPQPQFQGQPHPQQQFRPEPRPQPHQGHREERR